MKDRLVTVFGGSGFLGRYVVARLARTGVRIRVAVRDADRALFLKPAGDVGQIAIMSCDVTDAAQVRAALTDASAAINLTGILAEGWGATFDGVHVQGAGNIAKAAADAGLGPWSMSRRSAPIRKAARPMGGPRPPARRRCARPSRRR